MANVQQPSFCGHNQKGLIYILSLSSCDMVEEAPPSRFLLFFFLFLIPRTGDSRHRKRLLRHDVVQRWLLAEAERREPSSGPAAHQHGHQRHLPSDQGQGEEVGSDSVLTPGLTSDPVGLQRWRPSPAAVLCSSQPFCCWRRSPPSPSFMHF